MQARKTMFLRKAVTVVFTSLVAPVLVSVTTQETTGCQKALHQAPQGEPAAAVVTDGPRPAQAPHAAAVASRAESSRAQTPLGRKVEEWLGAGPRGR